MCYVKEVTITHRSGPASKEYEVVSLCANSVNGQTCENIQYGTETGRASSSGSQLAALSSSSRNGALVLHQDVIPIREKPRKERRYSSDIGIRFRGLFKSPESRYAASCHLVSTIVEQKVASSIHTSYARWRSESSHASTIYTSCPCRPESSYPSSRSWCCCGFYDQRNRSVVFENPKQNFIVQKQRC
ncbi:hypothetical protein VTO58DRAFT_105882 [Aureobasidium pullulans]